MVEFGKPIEKLIKIRGGKITLPITIRKTLDIKDGDVVLVRADGEKVIVTPAKVVPRESL